MVCAIVCLLLLQSCEKKWCEGKWWNNEDYFYMCNVYKFADGYDFSNNIAVYSNGVIASNQETRPIKLHDGYYLGGLKVVAGLEWIFYLTLTYDDLYNGNMPDDLDETWEQYVVTDESNGSMFIKPYSEAYYYLANRCPCYPNYYENFPAYCGGCNITQHLDTNILNEWIDSGTLEIHLEHATITL